MFCGHQTHRMNFPLPYPALSCCAALCGKREEEEIARGEGEAAAGKHHQQVGWRGLMVAAKEEKGAAGLCPPQPLYAGVPYLGSPQSRARECRVQLCSPWAALIIKKLGVF